MQPFEMTGEDLRILFFFYFLFFWRRGRRRTSGVLRYSKFPSLRYPPVHGGVWRENMLVHIMIGSFQLISEKQ